MTYKVELTPQAEKDLSCLDKTIARNIANRIDWFSQNIESIIPAPLKGRFKGKYKLRAGDWRVIYSIEHASRLGLLLYMPSGIVVKSIKYDAQLYEQSTPDDFTPRLCPTCSRTDFREKRRLSMFSLKERAV